MWACGPCCKVRGDAASDTPAAPAGAQVRLWQLGRLLPPRLCAHLEAAAALPVLYASSWLLTCFASDFPLSFAARVMDLVLTDCYAAPMMKVLHTSMVLQGTAHQGLGTAGRWARAGPGYCCAERVWAPIQPG